MLNKADTAAADNAPLFDLVKQFIKRTNPKGIGRRKPAFAGIHAAGVLPRMVKVMAAEAGICVSQWRLD